MPRIQVLLARHLNCGGFRRAGQRLTCVEQSLDVNAVVGRRLLRGHAVTLPFCFFLLTREHARSGT